MIDVAPSLPIYIQITELLEREIAAGHYAQGDRLPPESELAKTLNVAVGTLRKSLAELESRGRLERRQGSGTYVKAQGVKEAQAKSVYEFFRLELLRGGGLPTAAIIDFQKIELSNFFTGSAYRVRRLRSLNSIPVALEEIYFDAAHHPHLKVEDLGEALYLFYQQRLGFWISSVEDRIGLDKVPDWSPSLFPMSIGKTCASVERISYSGKNKIEEYSTTWFDSKRCRYVNRLK